MDKKLKKIKQNLTKYQWYSRKDNFGYYVLECMYRKCRITICNEVSEEEKILVYVKRKEEFIWFTAMPENLQKIIEKYTSIKGFAEIKERFDANKEEQKVIHITE